MRVKFSQTFVSNWRRFFSSSHSSFSFFFQILFYRFLFYYALFSFTRDLRSHCHRQLCRYISILLPPSFASFMLYFLFWNRACIHAKLSSSCILDKILVLNWDTSILKPKIRVFRNNRNMTKIAIYTFVGVDNWYFCNWHVDKGIESLSILVSLFTPSPFHSFLCLRHIFSKCVWSIMNMVVDIYFWR